MSRRRWVALVGAGLLLAGCAPAQPQPTPAPTTRAEQTRAADPTADASLGQAPSPAPSGPETSNACLARAEDLSLPQQVGQLYMMAIETGTPIDTAIAQLQSSRAGAVILLGNWTGGVEGIAQYTAALQEAAPGVPVLVAVDQEGGMVQRLQGPGFDTIGSAVEQAALSDAELQASWQRWGGQLADAGVHIDLAPVADVVPAGTESSNEPVGVLRRGYGSEPQVVAGKVSAVVAGLAQAGVGSSVKHYPGLGRVRENTDFAVAHDAVTTLNDEELGPFTAAIDAGAHSVMVSSAIYDQVDPDNPAVFSPTIITETLRNGLGFEGVVVSDDLGVAASVAGYPVAERGNLFLAAGGDMVVVADAVAAQQMVDATLASAESDPGFADSLTIKVARLLALKQELGLLSCG